MTSEIIYWSLYFLYNLLHLIKIRHSDERLEKRRFEMGLLGLVLVTKEMVKPKNSSEW